MKFLVRTFSSSTKNPLTRFETVPETLYRVHGSTNIKLRSYEQRVAAGMTGNFSYDLHEHDDGLVHPTKGEFFTGPNGMSLRPKGDKQKELVLSIPEDKVKVFVLPAGMKVPSKLVLYHEHTDHYSMQVKEPMSLNDLNKELSTMLKGLKYLSKNEFLALYEEDDEEAYDN
jgi:hypothetical protein